MANFVASSGADAFLQEFQVREPNIRVEDIIDVIEGKNSE